MAVLDGKYEITSQKALEKGHSLMRAVAPNGDALNIIWFDLQTSQEELLFETYRSLLRELKRKDLAAIYDIVSRPGAHYVAWHRAKNHPTAKPDKTLSDILQAYGYHEEQATVLLTPQKKPMIYGLAFQAEPILDVQTEDAQTIKKSRHFSLYQLPDWVLSWGLTSLFVLLGLSFLYGSFAMTSNNKLISIPDVIGQDVNLAIEDLFRLNLSVEAIPIPSNQAQFQVLNTKPEVGDLLRPNYRKVQVFYASRSGESSLAPVPELRGQPMTDSIKIQLEKSKLQLGHVAYISANIPSGLIIAQSHEATKQVSETTQIDLLVSDGPLGKQTLIPGFIGLSYEDAIAIARIAGIELADPDRVASAEHLPGTVLGQSIPAFTQISQDEVALRLTIAGNQTQASPSGTPSFIGLSEAEVKQQGSYTFEVETIETLNLPEGVVNQIPSPGEASSSSIRLLLNIHPLKIPIPYVQANIRLANERSLSYAWNIERGIGQAVAIVTATTLAGNEFIVLEKTVAGEEVISGNWETDIPGPITFTLSLNGNPYSIPITRN